MSPFNKKNFDSSAVQSRWLALSHSALSLHYRRLVHASFHKKSFFDDKQKEYGIQLPPMLRQKYHTEFLHMAAGADTIKSADVEFLVERVGFRLGKDALQRAMHKELLRYMEQYAMCDDRLTFEMCVGVLCAILSDAKARTVAPPESATSRLRLLFPLDPDSRPKQAWDLLCLGLLLYCSFYVPVNLAFESASLGPVLTPAECADAAIDAIFLLDVALTFFTAYYDSQVPGGWTGAAVSLISYSFLVFSFQLFFRAPSRFPLRSFLVSFIFLLEPVPSAGPESRSLPDALPAAGTAPTREARPAGLRRAGPAEHRPSLRPRLAAPRPGGQVARVSNAPPPQRHPSRPAAASACPH